jgi:DNA-binding transcriptional MerR regulator
MSQETYTFQKICEMAELPYSTGRFYRNRHDDFMYSVGNGRNKRYTYKTVEVLQFISNAYKTGATANEVQERLIQSYPINNNEVPKVSQRSVTMTREGKNDIGNAIAPLAVFEKFAKQQEAITEILQRIADRDEKIAKLERDNEILKLKLYHLDKEIKKPWWKKILGK